MCVFSVVLCCAGVAPASEQEGDVLLFPSDKIQELCSAYSQQEVGDKPPQIQVDIFMTRKDRRYKEIISDFYIKEGDSPITLREVSEKCRKTFDLFLPVLVDVDPKVISLIVSAHVVSGETQTPSISKNLTLDNDKLIAYGLLKND